MGSNLLLTQAYFDNGSRVDLTPFHCRRFKLPTGKLCLLGAGHIHFELFCHGLTSWIEVECLVRIPTTNEIVKNVLCQGKSAFQEFLYIGRFWPWERKQIGQNFWTFGNSPRSMLLASILEFTQYAIYFAC